ncbi:hypothetical protein FACS18949_18480 [Clostridia bacterium]|nr:hypothetical protein FACS18949_18480 [Clostridia bacterium]
MVRLAQPPKGGEAVSTYEVLTLMIAFAILIVEILKGDNTKK